jgi:hypothetical protein
MKKLSYALKVCSGVIMMVNVFTAKSQEVSVSAGADLVSGYIWRGADCGDVSFQPSLSVGVGGLSISAWGSVGFGLEYLEEYDFTLGYSKGGLSVAIVDYWFNYEEAKYFDYASHTTSHMFEATLGYDFGPLALSWNTFFAGADYNKADGDRAYSTYIEANAPFTLGGLDMKAELGITPWESLYSKGFNVVNIGLTASKEIKITDSFSVPAFTKVIVNPNAERTYFVFGVSF